VSLTLRSVARDWVIGSIVAAAIILASSGGDTERLAYGDGLIYRYVADHLTTPPDEVHHVVVERGTSLRYGRVGLPALIWLASTGRAGAMPWAHAVIIVLAAGAACAATAALFPRAGPLAPVLPFLAPGMPLAVAGGYAEVLAVGLTMWAVIAVILRRWWMASIAFAAALLTRENVVFVVAAIGALALIRRRVGILALLGLSFAPLVVWSAIIAVRYGHIPILDPYLRVTTETVEEPFVALIHSFTRAYSSGAVVIVALHLAAAVISLGLLRRSIFGWLGSFAALQLLVAGPFSWRFVGDGARTGILVQLFAVLAFVAWIRPSWCAQEVTRDPLRG
jgi:hypothetical protein